MFLLIGNAPVVGFPLSGVHLESSKLPITASKDALEKRLLGRPLNSRERTVQVAAVLFSTRSSSLTHPGQRVGVMSTLKTGASIQCARLWAARA